MMDNIGTGLQWYSIFRGGIFLVIVLIMCCCLLCCSYGTITKNYLLAKNSKITYKHVNDSNVILDDCNQNNKTLDCKYIDEFDDNNNNHHAFPKNIINSQKPPTVGNTSIYYDESDPSNYSISFTNPKNMIYIVLFILYILLIVATVNLYLAYSYKGYGAITGGIEAANDLSNVF